MLNIIPHLLALGNTPDEVAASLDAEGIKGLRFRAQDCPIANYLRHIYPEATTCLVGSDRATVKVDVYEDNSESVQLPEAVIHFIADFDLGKYPNLM